MGKVLLGVAIPLNTSMEVLGEGAHRNREARNGLPVPAFCVLMGPNV